MKTNFRSKKRERGLLKVFPFCPYAILKFFDSFDSRDFKIEILPEYLTHEHNLKLFLILTLL